MCPIDRHNRRNRLVKGSNCVKSAVPVIRAPTAIARTVIDRRGMTAYKGIEHRDRAEIGRLYAQSNATPSRSIVHSNPVRHKSPVRAMAPTTFRYHRPHRQLVATPNRCAGADGGRWGTDDCTTPAWTSWSRGGFLCGVVG
jgi:hypothetical protein